MSILSTYVNGTAAGRIMQGLLEGTLSWKKLNIQNIHWFRDEILAPRTNWNHEDFTKLRHWTELGESHKRYLSFFLFRYLFIIPPDVAVKLSESTYDRVDQFIEKAQTMAVSKGKKLLRRIERYVFFTGGKKAYMQEVMQRKDQRKLLRKQTKAMVYMGKQNLLLSYGDIAGLFKADILTVAREVEKIEDYLMGS